MAIDYARETKNIIEKVKDLQKALRYFPHIIAQDNTKLRDNLFEAYKKTLTSDLIDLLEALTEWHDHGKPIFKEAETKCGMAAGLMCDICAQYDCESNPEGKA